MKRLSGRAMRLVLPFAAWEILRPRPALRRLGSVAAASGLVFSLGCGGSTSPDEEPASLQSPIGFLTAFAVAYASRDSSDYDALLDSGYVFELLPEDIDPGDTIGTFDREVELRIAGNMFEKRVDAEGRSLRDLALGFTLKSTAVDETPYPGKPPGETWLQVTAFTDLLVVVNDPIEPLGYFPLTVASDQIFVLRRDPAGSGRFVVVRQIDCPSSAKTVGGSGAGAADLTSWGSVKKRFRW